MGGIVVFVLCTIKNSPEKFTRKSSYLASLHGKQDEAEKMYQRALQGREKAKLDEAEKMYQRAQQGYENAWGPDHTSTLNTVNNLGGLYMSRGKQDEAEQMYQRALQGYEKALGLEDVARYRPALNTIWNLGDLFAAQGRLDEVKEMYSRACTGFRVLLGLSSNECQRVERSIASLDATQGKYRAISTSVCSHSRLIYNSRNT